MRDSDAIGEDSSVLTEKAAGVPVPTLVMGGSASFPFMNTTAVVLAKALPNDEHRTLEGQTYEVTAWALDPSHLGAHSTMSAVGASVLSAFFGNQDQIRVTSDVLPGVARSFTAYTDVANEAGLSRI